MSRVTRYKVTRCGHFVFLTQMVILDLLLLKIANCALCQQSSLCHFTRQNVSFVFSNTLRHIATHCDTLRHIATHCNTLPHIATHSTHCDTLRHISTHCHTLPHIATYCDTKTQTHCDTKRHTRVLYNTITVVYFLTISYRIFHASSRGVKRRSSHDGYEIPRHLCGFGAMVRRK
jgi:hypothetical protein